LFSIEDIAIRGKTYKKGRGAKLQVIKRRITSRSSLRFLGKYAGRNLISARSLYPFDDAIDQTIKLPPNRIPFSLGSGNRIFGSRRIREHSLEFLVEFLFL